MPFPSILEVLVFEEQSQSFLPKENKETSVTKNPLQHPNTSLVWLFPHAISFAFPLASPSPSSPCPLSPFPLSPSLPFPSLCHSPIPHRALPLPSLCPPGLPSPFYPSLPSSPLLGLLSIALNEVTPEHLPSAVTNIVSTKLN